MRTWPLIEADLKGFMRNWRSVLLLIVFPLILITTVFCSFSTQGVDKIPAGIIHSDGLDEFVGVTSFLTYTYYNDLGSCLHDLKDHRQYLCFDPVPGNDLSINVYYDNTREPIIWEILERVKTGADIIQKEKTKEMASQMLSHFSDMNSQLETYSSSLTGASNAINTYTSKTGNALTELSLARSDMSDTLVMMQQDINDISQSNSEMRNAKNDVVTQINNQFYSLNDNLGRLNVSYYEQPYLASAQNGAVRAMNLMYSYSSAADQRFSTVDQKISQYQQAHDRGIIYMGKMDQGIEEMKDVRLQLIKYQGQIASTQNQMNSMKDDLAEAGQVNPDIMANPIHITNIPAYIPDYKGPVEAQDIAHGLNLISLQTIFPQMLLLIIMFLGLLVSSFITLTEINLPVNERVSMVKGIFIHEFLSNYLSSLIIMALPLLIVILLGQTIFSLKIMQNALPLSLLLFCLVSTFVLIGIAISYLIKNESIALVINTFLLLFFIFFSGFILAAERMSPISRLVADNSPGTMALSAFNKVVFYSAPLSSIMVEIYALAAWILIIGSAALIIKELTHNS